MLHREGGYFKKSYQADVALYPFPLQRTTIGALLLISVVGFPLFASDYLLTLANLVGIACIGAIGLNILVGYTGQISIGHGGFMMVGAYTAATLSTKLGLPWWIAMPGAGVMSALVGVIIGIPSLRIKGLYLAIATLAAQLIIEWIINHLPWISGGAQGSIYIDRPSIFGFELSSNFSMYYFILAILFLSIVFALNLFRTHIGRSFIAVRDRDIAAEILGVNIFRTKLISFAISSFYAGIAGVLYTYYYEVANYEAFTLDISIQFLAMVIIGGLGSILGSIFGAIFISLLPIGLDVLLRVIGLSWLGMEESVVSSMVTQLQLMMFGGFIMLFLVMEPDGLNKLWSNCKDYFKVWPFPHS